jgi:hypothetical protein
MAKKQENIRKKNYRNFFKKIFGTKFFGKSVNLENKYQNGCLSFFIAPPPPTRPCHPLDFG